MEIRNIDGLWTVEFASSIGSFGGGVTVFKDGKISGGDNTYFYLGEYQITGASFRATLRVAPFI
ncbi:MAG: GrlR family regulatory protein, partial [Terriglobales bacterium]